MPAAPETDEERRVRADQAALWQRRQEEAQGAEERAENLLKTRLGKWEYFRFRSTRALTRHSQLWKGTLYVIRRNAMVDIVDRGRLRTQLCVVPGQGEPEADRIMTILDLIESGKEEQIWEMANVFPKRP